MTDLIVLLITGFCALVGSVISAVAAYRSIRSLSTCATLPLTKVRVSPKSVPGSLPTNVVFESELFEFEPQPEEEREIYIAKVAHKRAIATSTIQMGTLANADAR